jgi:hypothetical protein
MSDFEDRMRLVVAVLIAWNIALTFAVSILMLRLR